MRLPGHRGKIRRDGYWRRPAADTESTQAPRGRGDHQHGDGAGDCAGQQRRSEADGRELLGSSELAVQAQLGPDAVAQPGRWGRASAPAMVATRA
jgi:hypothetical protein